VKVLSGPATVTGDVLQFATGELYPWEGAGKMNREPGDLPEVLY